MLTSIRTNVRSFDDVRRSLDQITNMLASTDEGGGADLIGVYDSGSVFTATTVRGILEELEARIYALEHP